MKITKILPSPYPDIDELVERLSAESKSKFHKIARALLDEANLTDTNTISVPFPRLNESNISDEDSMAVLKSLCKNNIASTFLTIKELKGDKEKPGIGSLESITKNERIFYNEKTRIHLRISECKYLLQQLEKTSNESAINFDNNHDLDKKELTSITIVTPQYGNFDYLWVVFNDEHKNKKKLPTKSKQSPSDESYGKKLYNLAKNPAKEINLDKSLMDHLNYSIWNGILKEFSKRNILKQENGKIKLSDGIILKTIPIQNLSGDGRDFYPSL